MKWSFMPKDTDEKKHIRYLVCNGDEGEPGTFKDRAILEYNPHQLIEGMIIGGWAMQCRLGFIYLRGEFLWLVEKLEAALQEARDAGYLGKDILGTGWDFDILDVPRRGRLHLRRGDGPAQFPGGPPRRAPLQAALPRPGGRLRPAHHGEQRGDPGRGAGDPAHGRR